MSPDTSAPAEEPAPLHDVRMAAVADKARERDKKLFTIKKVFNRLFDKISI